VSNVDVEIAHDKWGTVCWERLPGHPKVFSHLRVVGGDVDPHDIISFVTHHQLKGDEVGGHNPCGLHLKRLIRLPEQGNPPFLLAWGFCREYLVP
jgi:hypothetical protein